LITYRITDAQRVAEHIDVKSLPPSITRKAQATLSSIFNKFSLKDISPSNVAAVHEASGLTPMYSTSFSSASSSISSSSGGTSVLASDGSSATSNARSLISQGMEAELRHYTEGWGVAILGMQIESIRFADDAVHADYERTSLDLAKMDTKLRTAQGEAAVRTRQAKAEADSKQISAQGDADAMITRAKAESASIVMRAKAEADAMRERSAALEAATAVAKQISVIEATAKVVGALNATTLVMTGSEGGGMSAILAPLMSSMGSAAAATAASSSSRGISSSSAARPSQ